MAVTITAYDHLWKLTKTGVVDLDTDTLKLALVTSDYTPNIAHTEWDSGTEDADDPKYNEVATGAGYTTGGITLATPVVTNSNIDYDNPVWTALTKTFRYAVCYANKTAGGLTDPLLFWIDLDTTGDIVSSGSNYTVQWNATDKLFYRPAS
jgi:hypothetical protein